MNVLILVNNAIRMGEFHFTIGKMLEQRQNKVYYALTDRLMMYTENISFGNSQNVFVFSEFFKEHYDENILIDEKYQHLNLNKWIYSEYDRNVKFLGTKYWGDDYNDRLKKNLLLFFDHIIRTCNIDVCVYESISNSFAYAAYEVLKANNGLYIGYGACRMPNRFGLYTEEFGEIEKFKSAYDSVVLENIGEDELKSIDAYINSFKVNQSNSYHPRNTTLDWNYSFFKRYFNLEKYSLLKGAIKYVLNERAFVYYTYQTGNPLYHNLKSFGLQLKKQVRIRTSKKYFDKPNYSEKYYLYPQHFKPEASTSVCASMYCSDISNIENIAFSLPEGCKLYVKEHFVNYGRMPLDYYNKLKQIPNVKLIGCEEDTKELIRNSLGVITLTSTVGFEALMMGKKVYIYGNVFYKCHPNCTSLNSFNDLFNILSKQKECTDDLNVNRRFIKAYKSISFPGFISYNIGVSCTLTEIAENFVNALYSYKNQVK